MEAPLKFRTAWNGFHREDVVQYLEYLNGKHQSQVNQLNQELAALRAKVQDLEEAAPDLTALNTQLEAVTAEKDALATQLTEAEAQRQSMEERCAALEEQLSRQTQAPAPLDAYRRADTLERESRTRAELVYYQTNGVLTEASAKVEGAAQEITALADQAMEHITRLQMAVSDSKHTLQDAAAMMKSIRPNH